MSPFHGLFVLYPSLIWSPNGKFRLIPFIFFRNSEMCWVQHIFSPKIVVVLSPFFPRSALSLTNMTAILGQKLLRYFAAASHYQSPFSFGGQFTHVYPKNPKNSSSYLAFVKSYHINSYNIGWSTHACVHIWWWMPTQHCWCSHYGCNNLQSTDVYGLYQQVFRCRWSSNTHQLCQYA